MAREILAASGSYLADYRPWQAPARMRTNVSADSSEG